MIAFQSFVSRYCCMGVDHDISTAYRWPSSGDDNEIEIEILQSLTTTAKIEMHQSQTATVLLVMRQPIDIIARWKPAVSGRNVAVIHTHLTISWDKRLTKLSC